ncbi:MAG: ParB N-terminal domain-containing protein [Bacteroidetes bacterium]|nr:ParB N-terminal domain-containing protein [Bacteroidota bacterium]
MLITEIKLNPDNPRIIKDNKFKQLVQSVKDFPEMLKLRPVVIDENNMVLGGNMRLKACIEAGLKEVPVTKAKLSEQQKKEFVIKDNVGFGEWDWEQLGNEWEVEELSDWGLDVPNFAPDVDYSILDDEDVSDQLNDMTNGVKKAIQIEFEAQHYEEAYELVKFWREKDAYVGGMVMEYLKAEKDKL